MISTYISTCKWAEHDDFFMILMNTTIVMPLQIGDCFTTKETFKFRDLSEIDVEHLCENHCIGKHNS